MPEEANVPLLGQDAKLSLVVYELDDLRYSGAITVAYNKEEKEFNWLAQKKNGNGIKACRLTDSKTRKEVDYDTLKTFFVDSIEKAIQAYKADKSYPKKRCFEYAMPFEDLANLDKWYKFWEGSEEKQSEAKRPENVAKLFLVLYEVDGKWRYRGDITIIENKNKAAKDFRWWMETAQSPEGGKYETKVYKESLLVKEPKGDKRVEREDIEGFFEEPVRRSIEKYLTEPKDNSFLYDMVINDPAKIDQWNKFWASFEAKEIKDEEKMHT